LIWLNIPPSQQDVSRSGQRSIPISGEDGTHCPIFAGSMIDGFGPAECAITETAWSYFYLRKELPDGRSLHVQQLESRCILNVLAVFFLFAAPMDPNQS
jgi:hypothetical protein